MQQAVVPGYSAVSDADVTKKTGRSWERWYATIDRWIEPGHLHYDVVFYLAEEFGLSHFWAEAIATRYDHARGRRSGHVNRKRSRRSA